MRQSPNRLIATVFGAVYLLIGLLGFAVTQTTGFAGTEGGLLLGVFAVNPLHNIAHVLIGILLLLCGVSTVAASRNINTGVGAVYLLLGVLGLFLVSTPLNLLALNAADNVLHFASAAVLLAVGLGADRSAPRTA
jgi:hypothetical protein